MEFGKIPDSDANNEQFKKAARFIESAMGDPAMERVISRAREWEDYLQNNEVGFEKLKEIIKELDERWKTWIGKEVSITGRVMNVQPNNDVTLDVVDDLAVISNGFFMMQHHRPNTDFETEPLTSFHPVHQLLVPMKENTTDNTLHYYPVYAAMNDITIQSSIPSQERALMWLETTSPDFLDEIDRRIQKTTSPEESLLALRGLEIDAVTDVKDPLTRHSAELYLDGMIPLDTQMPFGMYLDGHSYEVLNGTQILLLHQKEIVPGFLKGVRVIEGLTPNGKSQWEVATPVQLHGKDTSTKPVEKLIPVDTLVSLRSMRKAFFENNLDKNDKS